MRLLFDLESDGLLDVVSKIHCIAAIDIDTHQEFFYPPDQIDAGITLLDQADELWAHNGLGYDLVCLSRLKGFTPREAVKVRDTLILSRLKHSDLENEDLKDPREGVRKLLGSHSLEAWGIRLGEQKIDFQGPWEAYTEEMGTYCRQDVRTNLKLIQHLDTVPCTEEAVELEHRFAQITEAMHHRGFAFDVEAAEKLCGELEIEAAKLSEQFKQYAPDTQEEMKSNSCWIVTWPDGSKSEFTTKGEADKQRKALGVKPKDCKIEPGPKKIRTTAFNLNSRKQVREYLLGKYSWLSPELSDKGQELLDDGGKYEDLARDYGSISEDVLRTLDYPEAKLLADYQMIQKRLGQVRDGENGWLRLVRNGRIHPTIISIGCATMRCAHRNPNCAQVPHVLANKEGVLMGMEGRYGYECRALFKPTAGLVQVGVDLSGIESRMLAAFLFRYDKGAYADLILNADVHQFNADAILNLAKYRISRNDTKTPYYASMYGAGAEKIGKTVASTSEDAMEEYKDVYTKALKRALNSTKIAAVIRWGHDIPESDSDTRFQKLRWLVEGCKDTQKAAWIANSVVGARVLYAFRKGTKGMDQLLQDVQAQAKRGYLAPLDGRRIPVRNEHSALNTLLQGAAAIVMKRWTVGTVADCRMRRIEAYPLMTIHDELQAEVIPEHVEDYKGVCLDNIRKAGVYYRLPLPLAGEAKVGDSWAACH